MDFYEYDHFSSIHSAYTIEMNQNLYTTSTMPEMQHQIQSKFINMNISEISQIKITLFMGYNG